MPTVLYLHRGRFRELPGATAHHVQANAWIVRVPATAAVQRALGRLVTPEAFDNSTWLIDDVESMYAVGSGTSADAVTVSVLLP